MSGFGGVIKLTGEKEYLNALKTIRQSLRETGSSLSAIASSFKNNARDMDVMRQAANRLKDVLKKQSNDANSLRSAYEKMQKIFENNKKEIDKLQKTYASARKELEKIEKELGKTSDSYRDQANEVKKLEQNLEKETKKQKDNEIALSRMRTELNNAEAALHKTRDEINKVEDSLKKSVETTKKASTEYGKLKSTIEKQEEVLKRLKNQYKEVVLKEGEASAAGKKLASNIKDLSGKLEDNKTKLKSVDDAAEKVSGGLKKVGDSAGKASGKFDTFKIALGNFISNIAIRAVDKLKEMASETFNVGRAFEYSMSKVGAIAGATGGQFTQLRDKAIEMGKNTIFTARESAEAMKYMAIAGWKTEEILSGIKGVLDLAASSGEDLAQVSDILTDTMTAFGVSASGASRFADVLTASALNANTNVEKMGETFKYVGPIAGSLGYSIEDTAIAIGAMADSGIKASQAGTDLRSIFTRLATNIGASKNQLGALGILTEKLGVEFFDASGKARPFLEVLKEARQAWKGLSEEEKISYSKTIAGQRAMSGWLALMNTTPEKFDQIVRSVTNSKGAAEQVAAKMVDNVEGDVKLLKSKVEGAQIDLAKAFEPETRGALKWLKDSVNILQYIADHSTEFKTALFSISAGLTTFFAVVQGPAIVKSLSAALTGLWAILAANPIGAVVALVAGLAAGFVYLWKTSEKFRKFWIDLWDKIKEIKGMNEISDWLSELWGKTKRAWGEAVEFFRETFSGIADPVKESFEEAAKAIKAVWDVLQDLGVVDAFKATFVQLAAIARAIKDVLVANFKLSWERVKAIWNVAGAFFQSVLKTITGIFTVLRHVLTGNFKDAWEGIKGIVSTWAGFFRVVWTNIKNVFSATKEYFVTVFGAAWRAVKEIFSGWAGFFRSLWDRIRNTFSNIGTSIANAIGGALKKGINGVIGMIENTINTAVNLINGAIRLINMIPGVGVGELRHLRLPRLAKGGVLDAGARTVIAGEDGAEAIVPLEKNTKWISLVANQLQKRMMPQLSNNTNVQSATIMQDEFNSLTNSFKQALSEMKVVMDEEMFGKFVDRTVSDSIYGMEA